MVCQPHSNDNYFDISEYLGKLEDSMDEKENIRNPSVLQTNNIALIKTIRNQ
jgi:hypothetical protein